MANSKTRDRRSKTGPDAIRAYLEKHPGAKPAEIKAALAKKGVKVGSGQVYSTKYQWRKAAANGQPTGRKPPARKPQAGRRRATRSGGAFELSDLLAVQQVADKIGGLDRVAAVVSALQRLDK